MKSLHPITALCTALLLSSNLSQAETVKLQYVGLSGPPSATRFHGPAEPGKNAKPTIPIDKDSLKSPVQGESKLTDEQVKEVLANDWYFDLHTTARPDGEIRAQLETAK